MKTEPRCMKNLIADAAACKTKMPWERGIRREAFIVRRTAAAVTPLKRTA